MPGQLSIALPVAQESNMENTAFWYPVQLGLMKFRCEGFEFVATNDHTNEGGTSLCSEDRHFMDTHLWGELRERNPVDFSDLIPPNPPCTTVRGTRQEDQRNARVIGKIYSSIKPIL